MAKTRLDIEKDLAEQVDDVVKAHREAGQPVTKNQVVADAISLYGAVNTPDLKLLAYVRHHYPLGEESNIVERWYTDFVGVAT